MPHHKNLSPSYNLATTRNKSRASRSRLVDTDSDV